MKVLVISHSCVTDVNQQQFVVLNTFPDTKVALIVPANWRSEYDGRKHKPTFLPSLSFPVFALPVAVPGHVSLHFYTRFPWKRIRQFRPDVLLSTQEPWSLSGLQAVWLSRMLGCPLVFQTNQNLEKRYPPPFCWIEQASYRTASFALAFSEEARQVLFRKGLKRASKVVPYGIDISQFRPLPNSFLRCKLGLCGKVVLGYMGRMVAEKGLATLVEAVKILQDQNLSVPFAVLFVGSGAEETALRQKIRQAGLESHFVFTGAVPHRQAGEYLNCMDIFVLPSRTTATWKEQFGRVIIEALACGVPVTGSNSGQIPYLLQQTGGGRVFEEGNADELAGQLRRLIEEPITRVALGKTGQAAVRDTFSWEAVTEQLHEVLQNVVCRTRLGESA